MTAKPVALKANGDKGLAFVTPVQGNRKGYEDAQANDGAWETTGINQYSELDNYQCGGDTRLDPSTTTFGSRVCIAQADYLLHLFSPVHVRLLSGAEIDSVITLQGDWIPGETKLCASAPLTAEEGRESGKPPGYVFARIACDNGPDHAVKIEFYGKEAQPDLRASAYRSCTRDSVLTFNDQAFTCRQTGGM